MSEASSDVGGSFVCLCRYFGSLFSGMLCDTLHSISLYNSYLLFLVFCLFRPTKNGHTLPPSGRVFRAITVRVLE